MAKAAGIKDWSTDQILTRFQDLGINEITLDKLTRIQINGALLDLANADTFKTLSFTHEQAQEVLALRQQCMCETNRPRESSREALTQIARKFWLDQDEVTREKIVYKKGSILDPETGGRQSSRTTEFKRLKCPLKDLEKTLEGDGSKKQRVGAFLIACLNSRQDGTIYLGIADNKEEEGLKHGEVVGIPVKYEDRVKVREIIERLYTGVSPKHLWKVSENTRKAFRDSVNGPIFIPIEGDDSKMVVEFDVRPKANICRTNTFYLKTKAPRNEGPMSPRGSKLTYIRKAYLRVDTSTIESHSSISDSEEVSFGDELSKTVAKNNRARAVMDEEEEIRHSSTHISAVDQKLRKLILRGRPLLCDQDLSYCLLIDELFDDLKDFQWISGVKWNLVLDMHSDYALLDTLTDLKSETKKITFRDMIEVMETLKRDDNFKDIIGAENKAGWLLCTEKDQTTQEWSRNAQEAVSETLRFFTDEHFLRTSRNNLQFVVLIESEIHLETLKKIVDRMNSKIMSSSQLAFLFRDEELRKRAKAAFSTILDADSFMMQSIVLPSWNALGTWIDSKKNTRQNVSGKMIPYSSGRPGIGISNDDLKRWRLENIDILTTNQCEELHATMDNKEYVARGNKVIKHYFKGGKGSWELFHYSFSPELPRDLLPGVIERPHVTDIKEEINSRIALGDSAVHLCKLFHARGSGATTVAMNYLWRQKEEFRCVKIDSQSTDWGRCLESMARELHNVRCYGELDGADQKAIPLRPVLVMLDNVTDDEIPKKLKKSLDLVFENNGFQFIRAQFIILYLFAVGDPVNVQQVDEVVLSTHVGHYLMEPEKPLFEMRLKELRKKGIKAETILEFVVLASNFEPDDAFMRRCVDDALEDIDIYQGQAQLLLYLSLINVYGGDHRFSFPEKHCQRMVCVDPNATPQPPFMKSICSQAKLFIIRDDDPLQNKVEIRVPHAPVAKYLVKALSKGSSLSDVTWRFLTEERIFQEKYHHKEMHHTARMFMVARPIRKYTEEDDIMKETFSPIVTAIQNDESVTKAVQVLKVGYDELHRCEKSYLAQALARLYGMNKYTRDSIEWADTAVDKARAFNEWHITACHDTVGQCHKFAVNNRKEALFGQEYKIVELEDAIQHARVACENFDLARKGNLYDMSGNLDAQKLFSNIMRATHSISGEMETCLAILHLILKSEMTHFRGGNQLQERFLTQLRLGAKDLSSLTADYPINDDMNYLNLMWSGRYQKFFTNLYMRMKSNLIDAVHLMSDAQMRMSKVAEYSKTFKDLFKVDIMKDEWTQVLSSGRSEIEKLEDFRRMFAAVVIKNFRSLIDCGIPFLMNFQEIASQMDMIIENNLEVTWNDDDKIGYAKVFFSLAYLDRNRCYLDPEKTRQILRGIFEIEGVKDSKVSPKNFKPDLLMFYAIFNWPYPSDPVEEKTENALHLAIRIFYEFYDYHVKDQTGRHTVYFKLLLDKDTNQRVIQSCEKTSLKFAQSLSLVRFPGEQRVGGKIKTNFNGLKKQLNLRVSPSDGANRDLDGQEVTFGIHFTEWGPFAVNVSPNVSRSSPEKNVSCAE